MITKIKVLARYEMSHLLKQWENKIPNNTIVISINDLDDSILVPTSDNSLGFQFDDLTSGGYNYYLERNEKLFTADEAKQTKEFITKFHSIPEEYTLYIHCFAGISRSGAFGRVISEYVGLDQIFRVEHKWVQPNTHIVLLLRRELDPFGWYKNYT